MFSPVADLMGRGHPSPGSSNFASVATFHKNRSRPREGAYPTCAHVFAFS